MIIWLNGTFGAGKTTTAQELTALLPGSRIFDTEEVGIMLRHVLASEIVRDFQDWQPWRALVVAAATIETDATKPGSAWRLEHLGDYDAARSWHSREAHVIDTTDLQPREVATRIADSAGTTVVPVES
ncbi:hypothetical protein ACQPZ2_34800 [Nocardia pseudovaccinii]|uniref:hypothetical protein n=1 Tax=Nocardia pseudovaccinii TaxID=189540 RepID=UPI003D921F83